MVIIACIRSLGIRQGSSTITIWHVFWLEVEACVAVCMVSITAFRSAFATEASNVKIRPWYSSAVAKLRRRTQQDRDLEFLPTIPSATLSGMRTIIRGRDGLVYEEMGEYSGREPIQNVPKAAFKSSIIGENAA